MRYYRYYKDMREITGEKHSTFLWYNIIELAMVGSLLLPPIATSGIIGVLTNGGTMVEVLEWAALFVIFYAVYVITRMVIYKWYRNLAERYHILVQKRLLEHIAKNDGIFDELSRGKIIATCTDDIRWVVDILDCLAGAISRIAMLIVVFIVFAMNNIWVALVAGLFDIIYMLLMDRNARLYSKHFDGSRKYEDKTTGVINQIVGNSKQIKAMNLMPAMMRKYDGLASKWAEQYRARRNDRERLYVHDEWMTYLGKIVLYTLMAYFVFDGKMAIETLVLLVSYFEQMVTYTKELFQDNFRPLAEYGVQAARVKKILHYTQKSEVTFGDLDNDYITGLVEFQNVSLKRKGHFVLRQVSFKARPNEITAIVGPKGAGKTSIVQLLHRLERVSSGQILIDGENIYNYSRKVYNSNVSGVFQKPFVLDVSIRDNLALVERNHKRQEEVCKRLGLDKTIQKLPQGYDTIVAEDESVLTEGDKQLLAVARAMLTGAEVLIFDEVSSVGAQAISNLAEILEDLKQDHTVILITHEKGLIKQADRIIEMENGKVLKTRRKKK